MKYENILFDLYGTLVDIRTDEGMDFVWRVMADFYLYSGAKYAPNELKKSFYKSINAQIAKNDEDYEVDILHTFNWLYTNKGVKPTKQLVLDTANEFRKSSTIFLNLYDDVYEGLIKLKSSGKHLYLLSNAQSSFTVPELKKLKIFNLFDDIFISSDYGVKKPSAKFFNIPIEKYNMDKEKTIMVGNDGTSDILGAKNVGLDTLYVKTEISPQEDLPDATYIFKTHNFKQIVEILSI